MLCIPVSGPAVPRRSTARVRGANVEVEQRVGDDEDLLRRPEPHRGAGSSHRANEGESTSLLHQARQRHAQRRRRSYRLGRVQNSF